MSEAQPSCELRKCPECGCERFVRDGATGEVVCAGCGVVVSDVEYVHGFAPKPSRGSFAVMVQHGSGKPGYFEVLKYG
ncbi:MAG: TFIIB-type zinc ribbon-containing protein, partial [Candidatus Bathyarchaeia archaeon]